MDFQEALNNIKRNKKASEVAYASGADIYYLVKQRKFTICECIRLREEGFSGIDINILSHTKFNTEECIKLSKLGYSSSEIINFCNNREMETIPKKRSRKRLKQSVFMHSMLCIVIYYGLGDEWSFLKGPRGGRDFWFRVSKRFIGHVEGCLSSMSVSMGTGKDCI